jgi:hypothetical protein
VYDLAAVPEELRDDWDRRLGNEVAQGPVAGCEEVDSQEHCVDYQTSDWLSTPSQHRSGSLLMAEGQGVGTMWDTVQTIDNVHGGPTVLSHDMSCPYCGHALHVFFPCGSGCECGPQALPGNGA